MAKNYMIKRLPALTYDLFIYLVLFHYSFVFLLIIALVLFFRTIVVVLFYFIRVYSSTQ